MVSRILRSDESSSYWGWRYERKAPSNRTNEIEIDNEAPCHTLSLERSRRVEELELYEKREHEKKGKKICLFAGRERQTETSNIYACHDRVDR